MQQENTPFAYYQPLFDHLNEEHGIIATESQMADIINLVDKLQYSQHPGTPIWVKAHKGLIPDGIYNMKLISRDNVEMRGTGLVKHNSIRLITFLNKSTMGINDMPKDYEGVYWLNESPSKEGDKQIDREWINNALVEFALSYNRSPNKDIANDAAEYLQDKLKEAGVEYALNEDEKEGNKEREVMSQIIQAQKEYIDLLGDELKELVMATVRNGWESTRVEQGKFLREKIERLYEQYNQQKEV